jgi:Zn-dependent alcohol dehydrogenase
LDAPRAGEVLLRLAATGLCHSDEHIRQGKLAAPPDTLRSLGLPAMSPTIGGHEGSGVVLEVGEGVARLTLGHSGRAHQRRRAHRRGRPRRVQA